MLVEMLSAYPSKYTEFTIKFCVFETSEDVCSAWIDKDIRWHRASAE